MVYVNLPFVFYIPNYFTLKLKTPHDVCVKVIKNWTHLTEESDNFDIIAEDRPLYYRKFDIKTPMLPLDPLEGARPRFHGVNFEDVYNSGLYRYTSICIEFDSSFDFSKLEEKDHVRNILEETSQVATDVVNYLITVYSYTAFDFKVYNVDKAFITQVYFIEPNVGFYLLDNEVVRDAKINNSNHSIQDFKQKVESGFELPIYETILLNSRASFFKKQLNLSVIQAFQSVDVFLDWILFDLGKMNGMREEEIEATLSTNYKTTVRIEKCLMEFTGKGLSQIDSNLAKEWHSLYKKLRKDLIHGHGRATLEQAQNAIEVNSRVIDLIRHNNNI